MSTNLVENESEIIVTLIDELYDAAEKYYQKGIDSPLTDDEFDAKLEYLRELSTLSENEKYFSSGSRGFLLLEGDPSLGTRVEANATIVHSRPMLSLGKAKDEKELRRYLDRIYSQGAKDVTLQAKLDGIALSVVYVDGDLSYIATRGDGAIGENVTYLHNAEMLTILGIPNTVNHMGRVELRGEIFFTNEQFIKVNNERKSVLGSEFKNSRNAATGLINKARLGLSYPVEFTYAVYNLSIDNSPIDFSNFEGEDIVTIHDVTSGQKLSCKLNGFTDIDDVVANVKKFGIDRESFTIPTDGVVIKPSNESEMLEKMGFTSHHPISQVAYKYRGESGTSSILDFSITVGKAGKITPTASIKPIHVAGSVISSASCHNFNWLEEHDLKIGSVVKIIKAGDVIPQVDVVVYNPDDSTTLDIPVDCPYCSTKLHFDANDVYPPKTLKCPNIECPSREYFALKAAVSKNFLNIDGLAEGTLDELNSKGIVVTISDLYDLDLETLKNATNGYSQNGNTRKLGEKRARNILDHIEKSKELPLWRIISSLNIDQLGFTTAKLLCEHYSTIEELQSATSKELSNIKGIGDVKAKDIADGFKIRASLISDLKNRGVKFTPTVKKKSSGDTLKNLSFNISGEVPEGFSNRNELVSYIEENGGVYHSSPKKDTSFVIGDENSSSSKIMKARSLNLKIISPVEFNSLYGR